MDNSFKELNDLHLKRPAIVMVKKPFATDAEMAHELRSLLFELVPQHTKSITRIVGTGKLKAVYIQPHIPGTPYILDDYINVPYFDPIKTNFGLDLESIPVSSKSDKEYFYNVCSSSGGGGDMSLSLPEHAKNVKATDWIPYKQVGILDGTSTGSTGSFQTYYCWVFDPEYFIPVSGTEEYEKLINKGIVNSVTLVDENLSGIPNKSNNLICGEFSSSKVGKNLLKHNNVYRIYRIEVHSGIGHMRLMSSQDIKSISNIIIKKYGKKALLDYSDADNLKSQLEAYYASSMDSLIASPLYISDLLPKGTDNPILPEYNSSKTCTVPRVKLKESDKKKFPISDIFIDLASAVGNFVKKSVEFLSNFLDISYVNSSLDKGPYLSWGGGAPITTKQAIEVFYFFYKDYLTQSVGSFDYETALDDIKRCIPLRRIGDTTSTGIKTTLKTTLQPGRTAPSPTQLNIVVTGAKRDIYPGSALKYLINSFNTAKAFGDAGSYKKVQESWTSANLNGVSTKILDFKYEWYKRIYTKYIRPRYLRLKACDSVKVVECSYDFVEDLERFRIGSNNISSTDKFNIVSHCDHILFNLYSGFYIVNESYDTAGVSKYANTAIYPEYISDDIREVSEKLSLPMDGIQSISNRDVDMVVVSRQVMGKSTCTVVIKNNKRKYNIPNNISMFAGEIVFEPMDEVMVFLPSTEDKLLLSFRGYVSDIEETNDNGYHAVSLSCDCPIKRLEMVRTNVKPSLSHEESSSNLIHPFTVPEKWYDSFDKWGPFMFAQGLTFLHSMLPFTSLSTGNNPICTLDKKGAPKFYDELLTYLWYKKSSKKSDQDTSSTALSRLLNLYVTTNIRRRGAEISNVEVKDGIVPIEESYYQSSIKGSLDIKSFTYDIYAQRGDATGSKDYPRTVVSQILGTRQPAFMIGVSDIPVLFSDYKTNFNILLETAEKFNFFLYSNRSGIVQFRPPQVSATELSLDSSNLLDEDIVLGKKDLSYVVHPDILSEQITASYNSSVSDEKLITWLPLQGAIEFGIGTEGTTTNIVENVPLALKYGLKSQRTAVITGISGLDALYMYGCALMDRNNKGYRSAQATTLGYGDMDINKTVYSPTDNTLYLREGLVLDYRAGRSFTAKSTLNWGRKPLFNVSTLQNPLSVTKPVLSFVPLSNVSVQASVDIPPLATIDTQDILSTLSVLFKNNNLTVSYYNQLKVILDYVNKYPQARSTLSSFVFNGYIWDGVSSISFEDLIQAAYDSESKSFLNFSLATGITSNNIKNYSILEDAINEFDKETTNYLVNGTGTMVTVILSSEKGQAIATWASKQPR